MCVFSGRPEVISGEYCGGQRRIEVSQDEVYVYLRWNEVTICEIYVDLSDMMWFMGWPDMKCVSKWNVIWVHLRLARATLAEIYVELMWNKAKCGWTWADKIWNISRSNVKYMSTWGEMRWDIVKFMSARGEIRWYKWSVCVSIWGEFSLPIVKSMSPWGYPMWNLSPWDDTMRNMTRS